MTEISSDYIKKRTEKIENYAKSGLTRGRPGRMKWLETEDEKKQFIQEMRDAGFTEETEEELLRLLTARQTKVLDDWNSIF